MSVFSWALLLWFGPGLLAGTVLLALMLQDRRVQAAASAASPCVDDLDSASGTLAIKSDIPEASAPESEWMFPDGSAQPNANACPQSTSEPLPILSASTVG